MDNTSGQGKAATIPDEIRGWSWGAFLLNWIWGLFNRTWIALAVLLPVIGFVVWIILGIKGNEWAWRNKRWDDVEHFKRVQRKWAIAGVVLLLAPIAAILVAVFVLDMGADTFKDAPTAAAPAKAPAPVAKPPAPGVPKAAPASAAPGPVAASDVAAAAAVAGAKPASLPAAAPAPVPASAPVPTPAVAPDAKPGADDAPPRTAARKRPASSPKPFAATVAAAASAPVAAAEPRQSPRFNDIMSAVIAGDEAGVRETIAFGIYVDRRDSNGMTPLMAAAARRELNMARLLLEAGADPRRVGDNGRSAMGFARENDDAGMVALLRRYGVPER